MSTIAENLTKLAEDRDNIATAISSKGVTVPEGSKLSEFPEMIEGIPTGKSSSMFKELVGFNNLSGYLIDDSKEITFAKSKELSIFNNELYCFSDDGFYKWNGEEWIWTFNAPFDSTFKTSFVFYNNEIHALGVHKTNDYSFKYHYKWNGTQWISVSTLPINLAYGKAVVFNNEIHIFYDTNHYKWNGTQWISVSTIPFSFTNNYGDITIHQDEIHVLGATSSSSDRYHYKWDGSSWSYISRPSYAPYKVISYNEDLYIISNRRGSSSYGDTWVLIENIWKFIGCIAINENYAVIDSTIYNGCVLFSSYNSNTQAYYLGIAD